MAVLNAEAREAIRNANSFLKDENEGKADFIEKYFKKRIELDNPHYKDKIDYSHSVDGNSVSIKLVFPEDDLDAKYIIHGAVNEIKANNIVSVNTNPEKRIHTEYTVKGKIGEIRQKIKANDKALASQVEKETGSSAYRG
jgi:hypothetical protein